MAYKLKQEKDGRYRDEHGFSYASIRAWAEDRLLNYDKRTEAVEVLGGKDPNDKTVTWGDNKVTVQIT